MKTRFADRPGLPWRLEFGPKRAQIGWAGFDDEAPELPRHPSLYARDPRSLLLAVESMARDRNLARAEVQEARDLKQFQVAIHDLVAVSTRVVFYAGGEELSSASLQRAQEMLEQLLGTWAPDAGREPDTVTSAASAPRAESETAAMKAARERRDEILASERFIDSLQVHLAQGGGRNAAGANNTASRLRRDGKLLGLWDGREFRHPQFQFDKATGRLMPEMERVLEILPQDRSGWRQAFWLYQPHARLDGLSPAKAFAKNPKDVIEAARSSFDPGDTNW